jgi:hypothetical protein
MNPVCIVKFDKKACGGGRAANDANNREREHVLAGLLTPTVDHCLTDPTHGAAWRTLQRKFREACETIGRACGYNEWSGLDVKHVGGRTNCDFVIEFTGCGVANMEFKFSSMPQFLSLPANKPFHPVLFCDHYYEHDLPAVMDILKVPQTLKPSLDEYRKYIHQDNYDKMALTAALYKAEKEAGSAIQTARVKKSIHDYLAKYAEATDLEAVTAELQRTQKDKHYLIYKKDEFTHYKLLADELIARHVVGVKGETLILQSACEGTQIHMMLRWKNHQGILFPAWQIKMVR